MFVLLFNTLTPLFRGVLRAGRVPAPRLLGLLRRVCWLRIRRRVALGGLRRGRDQVPSSLVITFLLNHQHHHPRCWACRPSRWREGVRAFPCSTPLSFGCQRRRAFPLPLPSARPRVYRPRPRTVSFADTELGLGAALPRRRTGFRSSVFGGRGFNSLARSNPYLNWL